jgi:hypothetical protein
LLLLLGCRAIDIITGRALIILNAAAREPCRVSLRFGGFHLILLNKKRKKKLDSIIIIYTKSRERVWPTRE